MTQPLIDDHDIIIAMSKDIIYIKDQIEGTRGLQNTIEEHEKRITTLETVIAKGSGAYWVLVALSSIILFFVAIGFGGGV
jgi:hypothetical protein